MRKSIKIYTVIIFILIYAPLLVLMFFSFNDSTSTSLFSGFSLRWYEKLFSNSTTLSSLYNSLIVAVVSSVLSTIIGTAAAIGINKMNRVLKKIVLNVTNIPMVNPEIVTAISMMLLFVFIAKILNLDGYLGFWTILIAHITFNLPYVILSVLPKLNQTDISIYEAAQDLGCKPSRAFMKVIVPDIMPGIITGMIMAFTLSLDDFIITYFVSGTSFQTLPITIFSMTKKRVNPDMYALSTLLFLSILILLVIINVLQSRDDKSKKKKYKKGVF